MTWIATVSARYIPMVAGCRGLDPKHPALWGIQIEPHPEGGVLIIAASGPCMAVVHDREGKCSGVGRVTVSDEFVRRCSPPTMPLLYDQGDSWEAPVPESLKPHRVFLQEVAGIVAPVDDTPLLYVEADHAPPNEIGPTQYRYWPDPIPWRAPIKNRPRTDLPLSSLWFNPAILEAFSHVAEKGIVINPSTRTGAVIVRAPGVPEFFGMFMPMGPVESEPWPSAALPEWLPL